MLVKLGHWSCRPHSGMHNFSESEGEGARRSSTVIDAKHIRIRYVLEMFF